jgi:putative ABC transport system permease protein
MELWIGAINLGFLYAFMAMGVFITFRIHDFPDITVDGSFTAGAAVTAVLLVAGFNPLLSVIAAFFIGALSGCMTALIHTRFNINGLLSGILVMTGLYSINLHIMGRSNIPLLNEVSVISYIKGTNPGLPEEIWFCLIFAVVITLFWIMISIFFKTDIGVTMRATGNNPTMAGALGVNVNAMKIFGISLANGLVGISGSMVAQYQGFADIGMGIGSIVFSLASVIIGESVLKMRSIYVKFLSVVIGSVIFRLMVALALYVGLNPIDLKLITAVFVLVVLVAPKIFSHKGSKTTKPAGKIFTFVSGKRFFVKLCIIALISGIAVFGYKGIKSWTSAPGKNVRIGVVQLIDHSLLNITRDSFVAEMEKLGYEDGKNCFISLENANGDLPTVNTIIDKFHRDQDIIVTISTPCTQAAINKIKDRPVVFATVANPFIIGAGKSDTDHLPNVTGVHGAAPVDKLIEVVTQILPGKLKIGAMWDPSQANSVFNVTQLKNLISDLDNISLVGVTITNSSEVYQAAVSLVNKGINAFVLIPDNIVYSAFEAVVKAAAIKKIPIFVNDVERLKDGALAAYGYDYTLSGIQAARLVDRILKGENPSHIPFERYSKATFGLNMNVARDIGITIPPDLIAKATVIHDDLKKSVSAKPKKLALFLFSDYILVKITSDGVIDELKRSGVLKKHNITIDIKDAQNDFGMANSVVQDIIRQRYDYIITLSTPALQVTANANKKIPHIFGAVTDPFRMGIAKDPYHHQDNITGIATFEPVESAIRAMRELFPWAKRIGIIWNPAEECSEACTYKARAAAKKYHFELLEATVSNTVEIKDALMALLNKKIDIFFTSGDNTVLLSAETIAEILKKYKIPYFTNTPADVDRGAFVSIGADFYEIGVETAKIAKRVINGEHPGDIPIKDFIPEKIAINPSLAKLYGITVPEEFLKKAAIVKK